ncbi:MAG TPA: HTTM domain-containing protein [Acidobacteriaceae bacterium]|nr:HTTM domain-containing protein [Acidobacteriaceae bacterium]
MTLRTVVEAWNRFFFKPQSPVPIALFRILYGICASTTILLLHSDWLNWYGVHSWVSLSSMRQIEPGMRLNLFTVMPQDDRWIAAFFWVCLLSAVLLTLGVWTRLTSVATFLCLASIDQRNLLMLHGGDTFLRVAGFFLMFAPAGAALSIDRLVRLRRGLEGPEIEPRAPWAQRMIQIELAFMYFTSFWWKMKGHSWLDGTALQYVLHLHSITRFPVPLWIQSAVVLKLGAWFTLVLEFSLGVLIWFRRFRYPLLLLGLLFHLSIDYALNLPMFSWDVLTAYILFVDPSDLERWWRGLVRRFQATGPQHQLLGSAKR